MKWYPWMVWIVIFIIGATVSAICAVLLISNMQITTGATRYLYKVAIGGNIIIGYCFLVGIVSCIWSGLKERCKEVDEP